MTSTERPTSWAAVRPGSAAVAEALKSLLQGRSAVIVSHDLNLIRQAKSQIAARVLRITNRRIQLGGADL